MAVISNQGDPSLQNMTKKVEDSSKFLKKKNVSWLPEDSLCQVRLFVAEDAPSLSGSIQQEFYQAKQTKFMHAATPVSQDDLPPGFEGVAVKCARVDAEAIAAVVPQITWRCPTKYELVPSWQLVAGEETTEASKQHEREVSLLEAIYPRASAIPPSPVEPPEPQQMNGDANIPEILLVPVDDEEECMEEEHLVTGNIDTEGGEIALTQSTNPFGQDSDKEGSGLPMISMFDPSSDVSSLLKDADLHVIAAAAAAYAATKATESGRMIDHKLLKEILTNPVLLDTLSVISQRIKNQPTKLVSNLYRVGKSSKQPAEVQLGRSMSTKTTALHEHQRVSSEGWLLNRQGPPGFVGWNGSAGDGANMALEKYFAASSEHLIDVGVRLSGMKSQSFHQPPASVGQSLMTLAGVASPARPVAPRQDYLKELIYQHGMAKGNFEDATFISPDEHNLNLNAENIRVMNAGTMPDSLNRWSRHGQTHSISFPLHTSRDDEFEPPSAKPWKQCFYFNTPRGCRYGANCLFLHNSNTEKRFERTRVDIPQLHQIKRPRLETTSEVRDSNPII